jgi:ectoine hydroxylase-related dioxygenase (phytanoyl-CoA dioxygenase family)
VVEPFGGAERILPDDLVEQFQRDGFVVVEGLLDDDELDALTPVVSEAVARRKAADTRSLEEKSRYEQSFLQCQNLWEDTPGVRPLTFHPRVGQAAAELLNVASVRLWHDQALFKEPGGRETDAHQDQPYWPIAEPLTVTAWVPLDGVTLDGGCMGYVPGSHTLGLRKFVNIFGGKPKDLLQEPALKDRAPVFVEVPRGGVTFHHGLTAHLARPNRTDRMRRVHTMIYFADGCTRGSDMPHPSVDDIPIEVGQPVNSPVTPVVWPRPAGDLPEPPPLPPAEERRVQHLGTRPVRSPS